MIFFIAGASLSGKSTLRRRITSRYGISGIDTDTLRTMANNLLPHLEVGHDIELMKNYRNMNTVIRAFVEARKFFPSEHYIIEGDSLQIEYVADCINEGFARGVILAYPHGSVEQKMDEFQMTHPSHWSHTVPKDALRRKVQDFISYSQFLEAESKKYSVHFVDSDRYSIEELYKYVSLDVLALDAL